MNIFEKIRINHIGNLYFSNLLTQTSGKFELLTILILVVALYLFLKLIVKPIIRRVKKAYHSKQYLNSPLAAIDQMSGEEFEKYLAAHFRKLGYKVKLTSKSNDFGADLILTKERQKIVVQAKRYQDKVGVKAVQEIIGAKGYYKADRMMVVSNNFYTSGAKKLAVANNVELWDRNTINKLFKIKEI